MAVSQYTPMRGLDMVRVGLAAIMWLPLLLGTMLVIMFYILGGKHWMVSGSRSIAVARVRTPAAFRRLPSGVAASLHLRLQTVSAVGVGVLFINLAPWGVLATAAQCLLSIKPDLIFAKARVKRLRNEVERLQLEPPSKPAPNPKFAGPIFKYFEPAVEPAATEGPDTQLQDELQSAESAELVALGQGRWWIAFRRRESQD